MDNLTIPKFSVGQRVTLHYHSYEYLCPNCGKPVIGMDEEPYDYETIVLSIVGSELLHCHWCNQSSTVGDGWYVVRGKKAIRLGVPYTLLEEAPTNATTKG